MIYRYSINKGKTIKKGLALAKNKEVLFERFSNSEIINISKVFDNYESEIEFYKALRNLLFQGYNVYESIDILYRSSEYKKFNFRLKKIRESLKKGDNFSYALEVFTDSDIFIINYIRLAEKSGNLIASLDECIEYMQNKIKIKEKIVSGLSYPILLLSLSLLMIVVISRSVIPIFENIFSSFNMEMPFITRIAFFMGNIFGNYLIKILILLIIFSIIHMFIKIKSSKYKFWVQEFKFKKSLFKNIRKEKFLSEFFKKFSLLYRQDNNLIITLENIFKTEDDVYIRNELNKLLLSVKSGEDLNFSNMRNLFTEYSVYSLNSIKKSRMADKVAHELSDFYFDKYIMKLNNLIRISAPVMVLFVGIFIGFIALSVVLPMFSLNAI